MEQIVYKSGDFQNFVATRSFALGAFNVTVAKNSELDFDGSVCKYAGAEYNFPQLRSAVKAGWLVLARDFVEGDPQYDRPKAAGIKVRPAVGDGEGKTTPVTTESDERVVMSTADHASATREQNRQAADKQHRRTIAKQSSSEVVQDQDGIPVRTLKTPAKAERTSLTADTVGALLREAENVQIEPGEGITESEMLSRMAPEDQDAYLEKKRALSAQHLKTGSDSQVVGTVKAQKTEEKEGIKLTSEVGGGIETADPIGMGGKPKEAVRMEDGITFKTTNVSEKTKGAEPHPRAAQQQPIMLKDGTADVRVKIARSLCPEFPNTYDFSAPSKKKIARLQADFDDRPDVIRAVFAAESDDFKAKLLEEFPEAFRG